MSMSKKEYDEFKSFVEKTVHKYVSHDRSSVASLITHAIDSGSDKRKLEAKLLSYVDKNIAYKLSDKAFAILEEVQVNSKSNRKRANKDELMKKESKRPKLEIVNDETNDVKLLGQLAPEGMKDQQIKDVMAKAQALIEERKRALSLQSDPESLKPTVGETPKDVTSRIAQLQARIQAQLGAPQLELPKPMAVPTVILPTYLQIPQPVVEEPEEKPSAILLDAEGRTVDSSGKEVHMTLRVPTLKANLRAKKREEFKQQFLEKNVDETPENQYIDPRLPIKPFTRPKREFKFHDTGKFVHLAQRERAKSRLEKLQGQISHVAKKTGISSAAKLAQLEQQDRRVSYEEVPSIEWWDAIIVEKDRYPVEGDPVKVKEDFITELVEHPMEMRCPTDLDKKFDLKLSLTRKETKKLRRMTRREAMKEKQEKIRLGLEPPPEPKVRMANLMRVLGTEAVMDPTKMENYVREQMAKRSKAHKDANAKRKLTPEQRKQKKIKKLKEDTSAGVHVALYTVNDLSNGSHKFKVETNAKQLYMTGVVVLFKDVNVIVVEGGPKQQKKYKRLMLHRIDWTEKARSSKDSTTEGKCQLVWEGLAAERSFNEFQFKACPSETFAREFFKRHRVEHYWDLAYGTKVREEAEGL